MVRFLISAAAIFITAWLLKGMGVHIDGIWTVLVVSVVIAIINMIVKPILVVLTLPITVLTLGLFLIIINAFTFYLAGQLVSGFVVPSFWAAIVFSIINAPVNVLLERVFGKSENG